MNSCATLWTHCNDLLLLGHHREYIRIRSPRGANKHRHRKLDPKLAEQTWVYKVFGGLLRSRVSCLSCGYDSDTFDRMLDLSVDIAGVASLRDALRKFVTVDHLRGADKYKCEKYVGLPFKRN